MGGSSGICVREAVVADAAAIGAIGRVAFPQAHEGLVPGPILASISEQTYSLAALSECICRCQQAGDAHFLVAEKHGEVVGYVHYDCEGPEPELHRIYVDPTQKRSGIGGALLAELHARLSAGGSYVLMVHADNRTAISFYQRHGLVEQARVDGPSHYRERMGVVIPDGMPEVPSLLMRYTANPDPNAAATPD